MKRYAVASFIGAMLGVIVATGSWAWASRNSSGSYTVSASGTYPFVTGTAISSSTMTSIFSDLATEMTDSLSRSGKGGMSAPLRVPDGTSAAPALSWNSQTNSGIYRAGTSDVRMSVNNGDRQQWTATGAKVTGTAEVTGLSTLTGGWTTGAAAPVQTGDARLQRASDATTGSLYFGTGTTHFLFFDGTRFSTADPVQVATPVNTGDAATKAYVDARFVVAGTMSLTGLGGAACGTLTQTGPVTATCGRNSAGSYTVTVAGLTTSAVVVVSAATSGASFVGNSIGSGSMTIGTYNASSVATDLPFSFYVAKL